MTSVTSYCQQMLHKIQGNQNNDEVIPFAQVGVIKEGSDFQLNKAKTCQESLVEKNASKERRNTVCGIEKATISAWDAGWNVSNAIQVIFFFILYNYLFIEKQFTCRAK